MQLELHLLQPGGNVWAIGKRANVDFPAFGVAFWCWVGIVGMRQDVRLVADDEVSRQPDAAHAFGRGGWHDGGGNVEDRVRRGVEDW